MKGKHFIQLNMPSISHGDRLVASCNTFSQVVRNKKTVVMHAPDNVYRHIPGRYRGEQDKARKFQQLERRACVYSDLQSTQLQTMAQFKSYNAYKKTASARLAY